MLKPSKLLGLLNKPVIKQRYTTAVIAAAGSGARMRLPDGKNKIFVDISGKSILERTLGIFLCSNLINDIVIITRECDIENVIRIVKPFENIKPIKVIKGGASRQESVRLGIASLDKECDFIAIHDCARCLTLDEDLENVLQRAFVTGAATAAVKVTDTIKTSGNGRFIDSDIDRSFLWAVQTPQVFLKDMYKCAVEIAAKKRIIATDDCSVVSAAGFKIELVPCSNSNIKITSSGDIDLAKKILSE